MPDIVTRNWGNAEDTYIAALESELKPGTVCTASRLAPPSFALTAPASSCYGNTHSQACFQKCLGKTAPRLTAPAMHNPSGLSLGLFTPKHLHVLSDQISGHTIHSRPRFYAVGKLPGGQWPSLSIASGSLNRKPATHANSTLGTEETCSLEKTSTILQQRGHGQTVASPEQRTYLPRGLVPLCLLFTNTDLARETF